MKLKAGSQKRAIKLINFQPDWSREGRGKTQNINIRNEKGDIITGNQDIKIIIMKYQQLDCNKRGKLNEMDKIFEKQTVIAHPRNGEPEQSYIY